MVIAIDGPSGVGKSTVARAVAAALGVPYLDTGSYYRAATYVAQAAGVDSNDEAGIVQALTEAAFGVVDGVLWLDGKDIRTALRGPEVTAAVSAVAAHPEVRRTVVEMQQRWVRDQGGRAVVEGRDIGTVVFPATPVKVFLTADAAVRARRRAGDSETAGSDVDQLRRAMERRDAADSNRATSPLRRAEDAVVIDTSDLAVADVVERILHLVGAAELGAG